MIVSHQRFEFLTHQKIDEIKDKKEERIILLSIISLFLLFKEFLNIRAFIN